MAATEFSLEPRATDPIETVFRTICTDLPVAESLPIFEQLRRSEARSMRGQPPLIWSQAEGFLVRDGYGNQWIDWSSGVLVGNAGHNHPRIMQALEEHLASSKPLMTYVFAHQARANLAAKLVELAPAPLSRVFLLTTGSEATEVCIKLARTRGIRSNPKKRVIVTYAGGFHGRTYGAQLAGGSAEWIDPNPTFIQVPFPGSIEAKDSSFASFTDSLTEAGVAPGDVAGVMAETFQGREAKLMPVDYAQALRAWCDEHDAALIFDEVQAGFGRTGKLFAFEHYGVVPDLVPCGKGISSSLPLSAVIGSEAYMDLYGPGEMTSTHTGSPLPTVAALASLEAILEEGMIQNAATMGEYLLGALQEIAAPYAERVEVGGVGLVAAMLFFDNRQSLTPDPQAAFEFCEKCFQRGNLLFAPVGKGYGANKFCPPLNITREAIDDGLYGPGGIKETLHDVMGSRVVGVTT